MLYCYRLNLQYSFLGCVYFVNTFQCGFTMVYYVLVRAYNLIYLVLVNNIINISILVFSLIIISDWVYNVVIFTGWVYNVIVFYRLGLHYIFSGLVYNALFSGWVYNVTAYMEYHPGGASELMRGAGMDATHLFDQVRLICVN